MNWTVKRHGRQLAPGRRSQLRIFDLATGTAETLLSSPELLEAPNWTPDGASLLFNAGGELWLVGIAEGSRPVKLDTGRLDSFNNDHLVSPDGRTVYASSDDGHIYAVPLPGGEPRRVENSHEPRHHCYLHGISPDGATLLYVGLEHVGCGRRSNLFALPAGGGRSRRLTDLAHPHDGPEYSPDGRWIYFNSERASPGHAQCFRMSVDGGEPERLTHDARVNWFPHPSPDGKAVVFLSYPPATQGHPPDLDVTLRLMDPDGGNQRDLLRLEGGQGTINVNSWAPDSRRFAFVAYPAGPS